MTWGIVTERNFILGGDTDRGDYIRPPSSIFNGFRVLESDGG